MLAAIIAHDIQSRVRLQVRDSDAADGNTGYGARIRFDARSRAKPKDGIPAFVCDHWRACNRFYGPRLGRGQTPGEPSGPADGQNKGGCGRHADCEPSPLQCAQWPRLKAKLSKCLLELHHLGIRRGRGIPEVIVRHAVVKVH
jgi:hypothetical protein